MRRRQTVVLAVWLASGSLLASLPCMVGCDATNARPAQTPVIVLDEDEPEQWLPDDKPPVPPVEYVRMSEWTPPPSVQALEAIVPPRGDVPPSYIELPRLTKHAGIGATHVRWR